jgi:hypothetical protein
MMRKMTMLLGEELDLWVRLNHYVTTEVTMILQHTTIYSTMGVEVEERERIHGVLESPCFLHCQIAYDGYQGGGLVQRMGRYLTAMMK